VRPAALIVATFSQKPARFVSYDDARNAGYHDKKVARRLRELVRLIRIAAVSLFGLMIMIASWIAVARLIENPVRLPYPRAVFDAFFNDFYSIPAVEFIAFQTGGILDAVRYTTKGVLLGVAFGSSLGLLVGSVLGSNRVARELMGPPLTVLGLIPVVVLSPFLSIWFGTSQITQSGLVIIFSFITVSAVVQDATRNIAPQYWQFALSLGANSATIIRNVVLPAVVPSAIGAVRVALGAGWSLQSAGELLGGNQGVGKLIQTLQGMSATPDILASLIALGMAAVLIDGLVVLTGKWVVRWQD
jgi:ABC-type nitrate/sulfonate/bicarbonate transport system permease component